MSIIADNVGYMQSGYYLYTSSTETESYMSQQYVGMANRELMLENLSLTRVKAGQYIRPVINGGTALGTCTYHLLMIEIKE